MIRMEEKRYFGISGIVCLFTIFINGIAGQTTVNQQALHTHLFTSYDAGEKPYCGGAVNVTLDLALRQVIDLDEPQQILRANVWVRLVSHRFIVL